MPIHEVKLNELVFLSLGWLGVEGFGVLAGEVFVEGEEDGQ